MRHFFKFCPLCGLRNPFHRPECARPVEPKPEPEPTGLDGTARPAFEVTP